VGTVPGQSAMVAAPVALRQLSTSAEANGETAAAAIGGHPPSPPAQASTPAQANTPAQPSPPAQATQISPPGAGGVSLMFSPLAGPVAAGSTFQLPVVLTGGTDIASVPMEIKYDPAHLSLVNLAVGDLLGRDGKAVTPVHRDSGPGLITMNAARPPGTAGISGAGVVYLLSFQAKAAGESIVTMTRAATVNSAQQQTSIQGARITIQVK
jgi:general secretion pathway protein D